MSDISVEQEAVAEVTDPSTPRYSLTISPADPPSGQEADATAGPGDQGLSGPVVARNISDYERPFPGLFDTSGKQLVLKPGEEKFLPEPPAEEWAHLSIKPAPDGVNR